MCNQMKMNNSFIFYGKQCATHFNFFKELNYYYIIIISNVINN